MPYRTEQGHARYHFENVALAAFAFATTYAFTSTTMTLLPAAVAATSMLSENKTNSHIKKQDWLISSFFNMSRSDTHLKKPSYLHDEAPPDAAGRGSLERAASPSSCKKRECDSNAEE